MSTVTFALPVLAASQLELLDAWLQQVSWESILPHAGELPASRHGTIFSVHRLKGMIVLDTGETRMVQGVRDVFEISARMVERPQEEEVKQGKMVIIGKHVADHRWEESLALSLRLV